MSSPYGPQTTATEVASDLSSHIHGKTILITGVTPKSLGAHFLYTIAAHKPKLLILASRTLSSIKETITSLAETYPDIPTRTLELDLSSQASVRHAAAQVNAWHDKEDVKIDVLLLNAGIMSCPYGTTAEGIELQFGTNHVGHFLFTNLLLKKTLEDSGTQPRVVVVSSNTHRFSPVRFDDIGFQNGEVYHRTLAYGQSKSANMLFALALAKKLGSRGLLAFSLHPGVINTNLGRHIDLQGGGFAEIRALDKAQGNKQAFPDYWEKHPIKTVDQGTATHVFAAFGQGLEEHNGAYLLDGHAANPTDVKTWARDSFDAERLWKLTEELVGETFEW